MDDTKKSYAKVFDNYQYKVELTQFYVGNDSSLPLPQTSGPNSADNQFGKLKAFHDLGEYKKMYQDTSTGQIKIITLSGPTKDD